MEIHLVDQTMAFLQACILGAGLGLLFDVFRILRIAVPSGKKIIFAQDVLYWSLCAIASFLFILTRTDGVVRFFLLAGELLGWVVYHCTAGILVMRLAQGIIRVVRAILHFIYKHLLLPIWKLVYGIISLLLRPFAYFRRIIKKLLQRLRFALKVRRIVVYNHYKGLVTRKTHSLKTRRKSTNGSSKKGKT